MPERQRLAFLKLLGLPLKPAQPARALLSLAFAQPDTRTAATLKPGGRIGGAVPFETLAETTVLPVSAEAYIKRALSDQESARLGEVIDGLARVHRLNAAAKGYQTTPAFDGGKAVPDGLDVFATSADRALWLALLAPAAARPEEQPPPTTPRSPPSAAERPAPWRCCRSAWCRRWRRRRCSKKSDHARGYRWCGRSPRAAAARTRWIT